MTTAVKETRADEIERLVMSDDLHSATNRLMDLAADFGSDPFRRREAVVIRRDFNALRQDKRQDPDAPETYGRTQRLTYQILELKDLIVDQPDRSEGTSTLPEPTPRPSKPAALAKQPDDQWEDTKGDPQVPDRGGPLVI